MCLYNNLICLMLKMCCLGKSTKNYLNYNVCKLKTNICINKPEHIKKTGYIY